MSKNENLKQNDNGDMRETPGLSLSIKKKITLIRHGVTEWNKKFRYQGITDVPLAKEGIVQAEKTALRLMGESVCRVISSPLERSLETAEIIAEKTGAGKVEVWDSLVEVDFGDWEGLTVPEIKKESGEEFFAMWRKSQVDVTPPNGEDSDKVYDRAVLSAEKLISSVDEHILVVGHGAIFKAMLPPLIGVQKSSVFWRMKMDNCSLTGIGIDRKNRAFIVFFNDTLHLRIKKEEISRIPLPWQ